MSKTLITFIVLSLLGLIAIQVGFLRIGLSMEKEKYDKEVKSILHEIKSHLYEDTELSSKIGLLASDSARQYTLYHDSLPEYTIKELDTLLKEQLAARGINVNFSFALTNTKNNVLLNSENFNGVYFNFNQYSMRMGGLVETICSCHVILHFQQTNLYNYLFSQLAYLLVPSLFFLLIIVIGFSFLIYNLNRQRRLLTVKNDFINNLTHELKTPVFSISLLAKVFRENLRNDKTEKLEEYLGLLENENKKLKGHIDKVLELASLENGKYNLQKERCDFHEIINEAVYDFSLKIDRSQGKLVKAFQAVGTKLLLDKTHFKNVIQNLLDNAIKYSNGRPEITISTTQIQNKLSIAVADKGVGISSEHQKHLFDKFYRVTNGNLHHVKGFGLGLSYVKYIVEAHGGSISVNSKMNEGSVFTMVFPFE